MDANRLPISQPEMYSAGPEVEQDELLSSSGGRLTWIAGAVVVLLIIGYVILPKKVGSAIPTAVPSFMLEGAAVTATKEKPAPIVAEPEANAGEVVAPVIAAAEGKKVRAPAPVPALAATAVALAAVPTAPVAAPEPEAAPAAAPATVVVVGRVLDEDGKPMAGATIMLKGSTKAISTDATGSYTLEIPAGDNTLLYGYGGYEDQVVHAHGGQPINVTLTPHPGTKKRHR